MGIGLRTGPLGGWSIVLGGAAGLALLVIFNARSALARRRSPEEAFHQPSFAGFEIEDILYLIAPVTWLGGLSGFLVATGIGAPLFAAWSAFLLRRAVVADRASSPVPRAARERVLPAAIRPGLAVGIAVFTGLVVYHGVGELAAALVHAGWGLVLVAAFHLMPLTGDALGWRSLLSGRASAPGLLRARALDRRVGERAAAGDAGRRQRREGAACSARAGVPGPRAGRERRRRRHDAAGVADRLHRRSASLAAARASAGAHWCVRVAVGAGDHGRCSRRLRASRSGRGCSAAARASWRGSDAASASSWRSTPTRSTARCAALLRAAPRACSRRWAGTSRAGSRAPARCGSRSRFLGHPVELATALLLESLGQAMRAAAFAVPGALGVQEGGFVVLGRGARARTGDLPRAVAREARARARCSACPGLVAWQTTGGAQRHRAAPAVTGAWREASMIPALARAPTFGRALNRGGRTIARTGVSLVRLEPEPLLEAARPAHRARRLRRRRRSASRSSAWCARLDSEARLNLIGRIAARQDLLRLLSNRLRMSRRRASAIPRSRSGPCPTPDLRDRPAAHRHHAAARAAGAGSGEPRAAHLGDDVSRRRRRDARRRARDRARRARGAADPLVPPPVARSSAHPPDRCAAARGVPRHREPRVRQLPVPDHVRRAVVRDAGSSSRTCAPSLPLAPPLPAAPAVALARRSAGC